MKLTPCWQRELAEVRSCAYPLCERQSATVGIPGHMARLCGWSFGAPNDSWCPRHRRYRPRRRERKQHGYSPRVEQ